MAKLFVLTVLVLSAMLVLAEASTAFSRWREHAQGERETKEREALVEERRDQERETKRDQERETKKREALVVVEERRSRYKLFGPR